MSSITTRSGKGSPLTTSEVDGNFTNLNTDKLENITGESIKSLSDVYSSMSPSDGQALVFDSTNGWQAENVTTDTSALMPKAGGTFTGNVSFGDNDKALFGAGSDLEIFHDGTHSFIKDVGTGHLKVLANSLLVQNSTGYNRIFADQSGPVNLYYGTDGIPRINTTFDGVKVTGDAELYGDAPKLTFNDVTGGTQIDFSLQANNGTFTLTDETNSDTVLTAAQNGAVSVYHNGNSKFATTSTGATVTGTLAATALTGDGSGLTNLPAQTSDVVDDTSPQLGGDLDANNNAIRLGDNSDYFGNGSEGNMIIMGADEDFRIFKGATNNYIRSENGGNLLIQGHSQVTLTSNTGENMAQFTKDGSARLFHDGSKKLETTSTGVEITGTVNVKNAYTLPSSDGSANQVLTTNGSGVVTFADAGGGSPDLFAENYDGTSTLPSATGTNAVAIGLGSVSSGLRSVAIGNLANASSLRGFAVGVNSAASGSNAISMGANSASSGSASVAIGAESSAASDNSFALGYQAKTVTGSQATSVGYRAYASGTDSFAAAIGNNTGSYGATGSNSIAMGLQAKATNNSGVAIGYATQSTANYSTAIGSNASAGGSIASGSGSVALGGSLASGQDSVAIGIGSSVSNGALNTQAVAIGQNARANGTSSIALGTNTDATSNQAAAFGYNAQAAGVTSIAVGNSRAGGSNSLAAIIANNTSTYGALGANTIAMGQRAKASDGTSIAIGQDVTSANGSVAIGTDSLASAASSLALGPATDATAAFATALGKGAQATHQGATAVGYNAATSTTNQVALGASGHAVRVSGAYTLPTSDGSANQVLQTDGSGALSFATVSGGGGDPDLYRDNASSATTPVASGSNAISIGSQSEATGSGSVSIGLDATGSMTNSLALGNYTDAIGNTGATAIGYSAQAAGLNAMALQRSYASGTDSLAAAIANNTSSYGATGANSIAMGKLAKATGGFATAIGESTQAQGNNSVCLGYYSQSQGQGTMVMGYDAQSTAVHCTAIGTNTRNAIDGTLKFSGGKHSAAGDAQVGIYPVLCETTDATATTFVTYHNNTITPQTDNQIVLPNNSAYAFSGTIIARQKASEGTACAAWKVEGIIRREANAGTTVLVNSAKTILDNTPNWDVTLSADTTNGCLKIEGSGAASTNIRWSSTITTSELIYA